MMKKKIEVTINGAKVESEVEPRLLLVHFIREVLRLTGTHIGCDTSHCGACTVLLDGRAVSGERVAFGAASGRSGAAPRCYTPTGFSKPSFSSTSRW